MLVQCGVFKAFGVLQGAPQEAPTWYCNNIWPHNLSRNQPLTLLTTWRIMKSLICTFVTKIIDYQSFLPGSWLMAHLKNRGSSPTAKKQVRGLAQTWYTESCDRLTGSGAGVQVGMLRDTIMILGNLKDQKKLIVQKIPRSHAHQNIFENNQ